MKKNILYALLFASLTFLHYSCQKEISVTGKETSSEIAIRNSDQGHLKQTKTFSADVAIQWMNMQVWQMYKYPGIIGNVAYSRHYAYSGIALYEAVVPGMPAYQSIAPQLNGLTGLPKTKPGAGYHWAASANAALAYMNKKLFPAASAENKAAMDDLEATLLAQYSNEADAAIIERSVAFGKAVAEAVLNWAETDGYQNINNPYTPPADKIGGVYWTPPAVLPVHSLPYIGNLRRIVANSGDGAALPPPPYDELEAMTIEVIQAKPNPGEQGFFKAFWWRDFPGTSTPGHYVSILRQVLQKQHASLDVAALAYALGGIIDVDITISTWQDKYKYLLARPFNYDDVIGQPFTALLGAPHPEYPAGHATLSSANAEAMTAIFGDNYSFTDSTFYIYETVNPVGSKQPPRSFNSFREAGEEAGWSRLYGGIHYRISIERGFWQGRKVAHNIISSLKFLKD
ncbi:vanadium-dependent haloperoxidase [Lacibacter sp.]|uniref:vanadium-dependent haloperoxidase n=1 Tax=Lacibacter sp. TaxID=1915409 RepID=UPI002B4B144B|nr:vanadium-dependent haloperoxidase [Lacibacter sp.]HLP38636.1 vanadium-dependent haloperoxidase [Lacibacter sp.]